MSRTFIGVGQVPYIGTPYENPVKICNGGSVVPLFFDWNAYGASTAKNSINVKVPLQPPGNKIATLTRVTSVYIDNTNSSVPIYVYCSDTRYACVAQPNSAGWYPLYTNQFEIWVIAQGFTDGSIPQTQIFVSDVFIPPYTDQELPSAQALHLASSQISRGTIIYNKNVGVPALGDQIVSSNTDVGSPPAPLFGTPLPSGFIYLTNITILLLAIQNISAPFVIFFRVRSTGPAGILFQVPAFYPTANQLITNITILPPFTCQCKLDATQSWVFDADQNPQTMHASLIASYTTNPQ